MNRSQKRLLALLIGFPAVLVAAAYLYMLGMEHLEGSPRGFWHALEWAAETVTTTGYGEDAHWRHPLMVLFVIGLQVLGIFIVFLVVPIYLIPFLEERFEASLPRKAPKIHDHVIIFRYGPAVETLLEQLQRSKVKYLVLEEDPAVGRFLMAKGHLVVLCPDESEVLGVAMLDTARALVTNGRDDENAAVILEARQRGFDKEIVSLAEEPFHRMPLVLAGADAVFTPRHILAAALAERASDRLGPRVVGVQKLGDKLAIGEVRIQPTSVLAGKTLAESGIGSKTGATVIGQWIKGRLHTQPTAMTRLEPRSILIVVGSQDNIRKVDALAGGSAILRREGPLVVAGFGEVGRKVTEILRDADEVVRIVEREPVEGVDVVGNVLESDVLNKARLEEAQGVILALNADEATLFATVIIKDLVPDLSVIARVNQAKNVERIRQAGADFALSLSHVSGQMLARRLLGEEAVVIDEALKVIKVSGLSLSGKHPRQLRIRERIGCSVVAVERGDSMVVEFDDDFRFEPDDLVYVCGSAGATGRFHHECSGAGGEGKGA